MLTRIIELFAFMFILLVMIHFMREAGVFRSLKRWIDRWDRD